MRNYGMGSVSERAFFAALFFCLAAVAACADEPSLQVTVNRSQIYIGESVLMDVRDSASTILDQTSLADVVARNAKLEGAK